MTKFLIRIATRKGKNERESLGVLSGVFGIFANLLLCSVKFIVGAISNSVSITADGLNNLSDAGSNIITIVGSKLSNKPIDKEHPFGHGRLEYISALLVSMFIFVMSFELGKSSVEKIINPVDVKISVWYIVVLVIAILVKLYMAILNNTLYKRTENINLKAVRQDSLNDCITTGVTIISLLISSLTPLKRADGIIGLGVAVIIFISGVKIFMEITDNILGKAPSQELVKSINSIILNEEIIIGVHDLIIHNYGADRIIASAHAEVPSSAGIVEIHDTIDKVEKRILDELGVIICIHMDPVDIDDKDTAKYKKLAEGIIADMSDKYTYHDFRVTNTDGKISIEFDLVIPYGKLPCSEVLDDIKNRFKEADDSINLIVTVEHSMTEEG